jgi:Recombination endonuclease VII
MTDHERLKERQKRARQKARDPEGWRLKNRLKAARSRARNPERFKQKRRRYLLRRKYGVTPAWFDSKSLEQNGLCAICKEPRELVVDHNHESGEVRGLLCGVCNSGLGFFKDSSVVLKQAQDYLEQHKKP